MHVRPIQPADADTWERMRQELWPSAPGEHAREIATFFAGNRTCPVEVLLACDAESRPIGFAELSIRPIAEECYSGRVAYLEGWFVDEAYRRSGVGRALIDAAEAWGRSRECTEFASDASLHNGASRAAHLSLGFAEVGRVVCFRKDL